MPIAYIAWYMEQLLALFSSQPLIVQTIVGLTALLLASFAVNFILKNVILRIAAPYLEQKSKTIDSAATWFATVAPLLVISNGIELVPGLPDIAVTIIANVTQGIIVLSIAMGIVKSLTYANEVYERLPQSRNRPIKGFVQVVKILVLCGAAIILISILINESPLLLLSGLGAITAVLLLVFKDTILSLVASVQLSTNDMLRVGDWIEMPGMNADGDVIDISLHTVKVQNFDKTITTIPTYALISDSFKNWRGMTSSGGRRIKRALILKQESVKFLTPDSLERLKKIELISEYITNRGNDIDAYNQKNEVDKSVLINGRNLTNLGVFRKYIDSYINVHSGINKDMTIMVRQLAPTSQGLPIEVYAFSSDKRWVNYEYIMADIFDHLLAAIPYFDLEGFELPSSTNFKGN